MIYIKWAFYLLSILFLLIVNIFAAPILSLFTKAAQDLDEDTVRWGWIFGTWDNPPQGDTKHQREGLFPYALTGFKGYIMRVLWLYRNPVYGFKKIAGVPFDKGGVIEVSGNEGITDKYGVGGKYFATYKEGGKVKAFEFYAVLPYSENRCFRIRIGWKIMTSKFKEYGFATLVTTVTPHKSFGEG